MSDFPSGIRVYLRQVMPDGGLARGDFLEARKVMIRSDIGHPEDYIIFDGADKFLACYPRDFVACILPLQTVGPAANAQD